MNNHCYHGYYALWFIKCGDTNCCGQWRSNICDILPDGKLPAPRYYIHDKGTVQLGQKHVDPPPGKHYASFTLMRALDHGIAHREGYFDDFNPQFNREQLLKSSCKICKKFFPTKKLKC